VHYFTLDAAFKRAIKRAGLLDFHFHDLRHTAITAMAEKLPNLIELSAVTGHKSLAMLKRYYHPNIEDLAKKKKKTWLSPQRYKWRPVGLVALQNAQTARPKAIRS
jgi:integrase